MKDFQPMWDLTRLVQILARVLRTREAELKLEQAVYGIDSLDEVQLHSVLAAGLAKHYTVTRESYYPSSAGKKRTLRNRCDLVLTPPGRPLAIDWQVAGLFDAKDQAGPEEALWLEVKVAKQFKTPGERHRGYGAQWRNSLVSDIRKIESEGRIREAALLLLVFTENQFVIESDLELFENVLVEQEVLAGFRKVEHVKIADRIGHSRATVGIWPTICRCDGSRVSG